MRGLVPLVLALALGGCAYLSRPATVPMETRFAAGACPAADAVFVLLPGVYSSIDEFEREGFLRAVRERRIAADILVADAHRAYYDNASIGERLDADVIAPMRARGYRSIWLVGISLGGAGALVYAARRPGEIAGVVALAPYLGDPPVTPDVVTAVRPRLYLGYGDSDRFVAAHRLLAATLPAERVFRTPGGHDWPVWRVLWERTLDALPLRRCAA